MNKINVMTMSMVRMILGKYRFDHDRSEMEDLYEEILDMVKRAGFDGVDVMSWEQKILGRDYVKEQLKKRGLKVSSYIHFDFYAQDIAVKERIQAGYEAADTAVFLETAVLMLVPMGHEDIERESPGTIHQRLIRHFIPIAAYAVEKGLQPVIEDTPDLRLHLCEARDVQAVLDAVPNLKLVYDSGNMLLGGEDPVAYLQAFAHRIGYVHLKDIQIAKAETPGSEKMQDGTPVETVHTGTGIIDIPGVIKALRESGYLGGITVEIAKKPDLSYEDSLLVSRKYVAALLKA